MLTFGEVVATGYDKILTIPHTRAYSNSSTHYSFVLLYSQYAVMKMNQSQRLPPNSGDDPDVAAQNLAAPYITQAALPI